MPVAPDSFFRGQTVLVTGASGGIGAAMARQLGAFGARVILVARSDAALAAVAHGVTSAGGTARVVPADLGVPGASETLVEQIREPVHVLIANAGFGVHARFAETDPNQVRGMIQLNVLAVTDLARLALPPMLATRGGGILTVASIASFVPAPTFAVYAATKAYVRSFSEALHAELRGSGVHASCLCPGPVPTGFGRRAGVADAFFGSALTGTLSAETVARAGLDGLARDRRLVVPGVSNKVQTVATRFVPTGIAMRVARAVLGP